MVANNGFEYGQVLRIAHTTEAPAGHCYLSDQADPILVQYCRDATLAQDRLLYDVWNFYESRHLGYLVPVSVFQTADKSITYADDWAKYPKDKQIKLRDAHCALTRIFPKLPALSAKRLAEMVVYERRSMAKKNIEKMVVDHARHEYTDNDLRLEGGAYDRKLGRMSIAEAHHVIAPRMREVLKSWLPEDIAGGDLGSFYRRYDLFEPGSKDGLGLDVVEAHWTLQYYGGQETVANIRSAAWAKL